jgi:hypothetical protein
MSTLTTPRPTQPRVGTPTQLGAYTVSGENRVLIGQRINGVVRLSDQPATGRGRRYLIERGLEVDGQAAVDALISDYLKQAHRHQQIPADYVPLASYLAAVDAIAQATS